MLSISTILFFFLFTLPFAQLSRPSMFPSRMLHPFYSLLYSRIWSRPSLVITYCVHVLCILDYAFVLANKAPPPFCTPLFPLHSSLLLKVLSSVCYHALFTLVWCTEWATWMTKYRDDFWCKHLRHLKRSILVLSKCVSKPKAFDTLKHCVGRQDEDGEAGRMDSIFFS